MLNKCINAEPLEEGMGPPSVNLWSGYSDGSWWAGFLRVQPPPCRGGPSSVQGLERDGGDIILGSGHWEGGAHVKGKQ